METTVTLRTLDVHVCMCVCDGGLPVSILYLLQSLLKEVIGKVVWVLLFCACGRSVFVLASYCHQMND